MCDPPRIYPSLPESTPLFNKFICATLPESTPPSQNIPPFQPGIVWEGGWILGASHKVVEKEGIFWEGGVDAERVTHINLLKRGVYSEREGANTGRVA